MTIVEIYRDTTKRLKGYADGSYKYRVYRGETPPHEPTLKRDISLIVELVNVTFWKSGI